MRNYYHEEICIHVPSFTVLAILRTWNFLAYKRRALLCPFYILTLPFTFSQQELLRYVTFVFGPKKKLSCFLRPYFLGLDRYRSLKFFWIFEKFSSIFYSILNDCHAFPKKKKKKKKKCLPTNLKKVLRRFRKQDMEDN